MLGPFLHLTFLQGLISSLSRSKTFFYLFAFFLWLLASLRSGQGPDYYPYAIAYKLLDDNPIQEMEKVIVSQEPLFRLIGSVCKNIGLNYQGYLAVVAFFSIFFITRVISKYSKYPVLSLLLFYAMFYFTWPYSGLRQGLTICIGTYYLTEAVARKYNLKYLFVSVILSLVHLSAITSSGFLLIKSFFLKTSYVFCFAFFSIILSITLNKFIPNILSAIPFADRILFYKSEFGSTSYLDFKTISRFIFWVIGLVFYLGFKRVGDELNAKLTLIAIFSFPVYLTLKFSEILAAHISLYGFILYILIIPNYLYMVKGLIPKNIKFLLITLLCCLFYLKTFNYMQTASKQNLEHRHHLK
jgi:hypothetical protein